MNTLTGTVNGTVAMNTRYYLGDHTPSDMAQ